VSAMLVVLAMTAIAIGAGLVLIHRARELTRLSQRQRYRGRDQELHWAAIRLRSEGRQGQELQELLCAETNCRPAEADNAIFSVGAHI